MQGISVSTTFKNTRQFGQFDCLHSLHTFNDIVVLNAAYGFFDHIASQYKVSLEVHTDTLGEGDQAGIFPCRSVKSRSIKTIPVLIISNVTGIV